MRFSGVNVDLKFLGLRTLEASQEFLLDKHVQRAFSLLHGLSHHCLVLINTSVNVNVYRFLRLVHFIVILFNHTAQLVRILHTSTSVVNSKVLLLESSCALLVAKSDLVAMTCVRTAVL